MSPPAPAQDKIIEVAIPAPMFQTFSYLWEEPLEPGTRVLVPFGRRRVVGVAVSDKKVTPQTSDTPDPPRAFKLRRISKVVDQAPSYSADLLKLARWMSEYYFHPLGEVLRTMLPASTQKSASSHWHLSDEAVQLMEALHPDTGLKDSEPARIEDTRSEEAEMARFLQTIFGKRKSLTQATVKKKLGLLKEPTDPSIAERILSRAKKQGLVTATMNRKVVARDQDRKGGALQEGAGGGHAPAGANLPLLTKEQAEVMDVLLQEGIAPLFSGRPCEASEGHSGLRPFLLQGVTGSGKTEVYLRSIAACLEAGIREDEAVAPQALLLVPEISLTPQMTQVFESRFPGKVAVVHSAMSDSDRWKRLEAARHGEATILIGPRSAVFASFANLKLILVDEEHDSSYKQASGLCYNGRDVAVMRGRIERVCVVLGSATPSLESYQNANSGKYHHLLMTNRVANRPLPEISVIQSVPGYMRGKSLAKGAGAMGQQGAEQTADSPIADEVIAALQENLERGLQSIVLVNRRGYAYFLFDVKSREPYLCKNCSVSMTLHSRSTILHCHYCDHRLSVSQVKQDNPNSHYVAVGYGSQRAEDSLRASIPEARIARLDSDVITKRDLLPKTLATFRSGETDILVGTQILAKGHDFPKVTLIGILEIDQLLSLPDFRAGERTFQLLVQAAGRAGRGETPGRVVMQSSRADHPIIQAGLSQDYAAFAERELAFRRSFGYPPFGRLVLIEINGEKSQAVEDLGRKMGDWLDQFYADDPAAKSVRILGPAVPGIEILRKRHRRTILFMGSHIPSLRRAVSKFLTEFDSIPNSIRMTTDVDPQSIL